MKKTLTDVYMQKLRAPKQGRFEVHDLEQRGLVLRVSEAGLLAWTLVYRVAGEGGVGTSGRLKKGRQRRLTLGSYPEIGLAEAREQAREARKLAMQGSDPGDAHKKQIMDQHQNTVAAVAKEMVDARTISSKHNIDRAFRLHVNPVLGGRPISGVVLADVNRLLNAIIASGANGTAIEVRKHMHALFKYAHQMGIVANNIMLSLDRRDISYTPEVKALTDKELSASWKSAAALGYPHGTAFQLLMLTGARKLEIANARWSEIDTERKALVIPKERTKMRRPFVLPFSDAAWEIVKAIPRWNDGDYLFSLNGGKAPITAGTSMMRRFREYGGDDDTTLDTVRVKDFRDTLRTRLSALGIPREIAERCIAHQTGLDAVYSAHEYIDEKRDAFDTYAQHLVRIANAEN